MRGLAVWVVALAVLGAPSCRRALDTPEDGGDTGILVRPDGGPADLSPIDVPADIPPADAAAEAPRPDAGGDAVSDAGADLIPGATCPADVAWLDVCNCCCGGAPQVWTCYYPTLGQSRETVPNPMPSQEQCATAGCGPLRRHLCCADPGPQPGVVTVCSNNTSDEDYPRFQVTRRDGPVCTTLEIVPTAFGSPIMGTGLSGRAYAWRGPCDDGATQNAIGGLGSLTPSPLRHVDGNIRYDLHVALFFDSGTGIADVVRIDADDVTTGAICQKGFCPVCGGTCAFDARYEYGRTGGRTRYSHRTILDPLDSFAHVASSTSTPPQDQWCAPLLPSCGGGGIDVGDAMAALTDRDVQDAFERSKGAATTPLYGTDPRVFDGQVFQITRAGGGGFLVGGPCPAGAPTSSCMPIPGGLGRLVSVLTALDEQQLADPACAGLPR